MWFCSWTGTAWLGGAGNTGLDVRLAKLIRAAIQMAFYYLGCAEIHGTEEEAGNAIKEPGVLRDKLFVAVPHGTDDIRAAVEEGFQEMQPEYSMRFRLSLLHTPSRDSGQGHAQRRLIEEFQCPWMAMELGRDLKRRVSQNRSA